MTSPRASVVLQGCSIAIANYLIRIVISYISKSKHYGAAARLTGGLNQQFDPVPDS